MRARSPSPDVGRIRQRGFELEAELRDVRQQRTDLQVQLATLSAAAAARDAALHDLEARLAAEYATSTAVQPCGACTTMMHADGWQAGGGAEGPGSGVPG